jgi:DNA-binding NarL/FixJ family response regulator
VPSDLAASAGAPISVLIVDDHQMVRDGLKAWLEEESDVAVVGAVGTIGKALELAADIRPDVVLMDFHLPDGDGIEATIGIIAAAPQASVIMMSGSVTDDLLSRAISAGCCGFLAKERGSTDLVNAVRSAAKGETLLPREVLAALVGRMRNPTPKPEHGLTKRELEVLHLLAQGLSTSAICERLFLSEHTTRNHVRNILMKLGAHSKLEAVATATREGLLHLADFE